MVTSAFRFAASTADSSAATGTSSATGSEASSTLITLDATAVTAGICIAEIAVSLLPFIEESLDVGGCLPCAFSSSTNDN